MKNSVPIANSILFVKPHSLNSSLVSTPEIVVHLVSNAA